MADQESENAFLRREIEAQRRRADEARREIEAQRRRADEATQRADRLKQERNDAVISAAHFRHRNEELERERRLEQEKQTFRRYLWQVSSLQRHLSRLIPLPAPATDSKTSKSRANKAATTENQTSSTKTTTESTTHGQTSIAGKYYPLQVRPWTDFADQIGDAFAQLDGQLGDRQVFPSSLFVQADEVSLLDALPAQFLGTEYFHSEERTSLLIGAMLERPSSKVLAEYFAAGGQGKAVFFDNKTACVRTVALSANQNTESLSFSGQSSDMELMTSSSTSDSVVDESDPPPQSTRRRITQKTMPDCIVLSVDLNAARGDDTSRRRVVIGEHNSCHALPAAELAALPALASDCLVRLATNRRKALKVQKQPRKSLHQIENSVPPRGKGRSGNTSTSTTKQDSSSSMTPLQVYFATALAQTYHYMMLSGLAYGYLASGETLTFLCIPESEPTTLLYHTAIFPGVAPQDLPQKDGQPVYPCGVTAPSAIAGTAPADDASWAAAANASAIVQMCGLCLLAFASPVRDVEWTSKAAAQLAGFPSLPLGLRRRYSSSVSPAGVRRRDDDDSDTDNESRRDQADDDIKRGRGLPGRVTRLRSEQVRAPSPLRQTNMDTDRSHTTPTANKACSYCTQACLLGLARGLALNAACPNYALHKAALTDATATGTDKDTSSERHPITLAELRWLLCQQLQRSITENCWCLYDEGARGAIGCLFKIRLSGYGYTFVAKGVEKVHLRKLRRETRIYHALHAQQGVLMPVHLGLIKLLAPYPLMQRFASLTHFMLLSHAGVVLHHGPQLVALSEKLGRDLEEEIAITYDKLLDLGVEDFDENVYNAAWCEEVQQVMKFDFDHAHLDPTVHKQQKARSAVEVADVGDAVEAADMAAQDRKRKHDAAGHEQIDVASNDEGRNMVVKRAMYTAQ